MDNNIPSGVILPGQQTDNLYLSLIDRSIEEIHLDIEGSIRKFAFNGCTKLKSAYLPNVTTLLGQAFFHSRALTTAYLPNVTTLVGADFTGCNNLTDLTLGPIISDLDLSECPKLTATSIKRILGNVGIVTGKTINLTGCIGYNELTGETPELVNALSKGWAIVPEIKTSSTLKKGRELNDIWNKGMTKFEKADRVHENVTPIDISANNNGSIVTWSGSTTQYWYTNVDIVYMNPDSSGMFSECHTLASLDLSMFDTSKVLDMNGMFLENRALTNVNLSSFDTSNVTNMYVMFGVCNSLTTLDLSSFNTSKTTNMLGMFIECSKLTNITYGPNFTNTSNPDIAEMFTDCPANKPSWWV